MLEAPQNKQKTKTPPAATPKAAPAPAKPVAAKPKPSITKPAAAKPMIGPQLPPKAKLPQRSAKPAVATPPKTSGIMDFFGKKLSGLAKLGSTQLTNIRDQAKNLAVGAKNFAKNPAKAIKAGASAAMTAAFKKTVGVADFAKKKVNQFKTWYATPEGKAKFWKGVALTGVGLATVVSGGALTAPALALAAGISAAGGVGATMVENAVFNAAAKTKASKDKKYTYKQRGLLQGVSAKSIAVDAVVGSLGGPLMKFAGKAVVGTALAVGKGALPAARGLGQLGLAAGKGVARRIVPAGLRDAAQASGSAIKKYALDPSAKFLKKMGAGAKKLASNAQAKVGKAKNWVAQKTAPARQAVGKKLGAANKVVKDGVKALRKKDRRLLTRLKVEMRRSPTVKAAKKAQAFVDGRGNAISKKLVGGKVKAADALDTLSSKTGQKLGQTRVAQQIRGLKESTVKRLDDIVAANPNGNVSKAILEFRASGKAIQTHLNKVWGEASKDLNKDLSRHLGRYGSLQADFKNLAEKGSKELYEQEVTKAKQIVTDRFRTKVEQDFEVIEIAKRVKSGIRITDSVRQQVREQAQISSERAASKSSERLIRQAETFVARHPDTKLEMAALRVQGIESAKKVSEQYFGKEAGKKGLLERTGLMISAPLRKPINERVEKWGKIVEAARSGTPLASVTLVGVDGLSEVMSKQVSEQIKEKVDAKASEWKGEPAKPKKAKEEQVSELHEIEQKTLEEIAPTGSLLEEMWESMQKSLNVKVDDLEAVEDKK
ncbi:hypothetical protein Dxin01_02868 [Deinococcus xinjiangensis]|uniref:Uncharacterized protein n=1 Tax=Deinococcus xinjiangensis TaxID=457454 RepID=A0ABP9VD01_9DEIO